MIITLKGANFSASNIGTLSTYSIRFNSNGITNTNTSVDRETNTGYTATITFKENYELNGAITVTMGGADITSTAVSGLNINITKVTGNVVITVPAKSTATGDEGNGGGTEDEEPTNPTEGFITFTILEKTYTNKDGATATSENWNTTEMIPVIPNTTYTYYGDTSLGSGAVAAVYYYDSEQQPIASLLLAIAAADGKAFDTPANAAYVRISSHKDTELKLEYTPNAIVNDYIANGYVDKVTGEFKTASGWTRTNMINVTNNRSIKYTGTVPSGGLATVAALYGYDANRQSLEMVLAPATDTYLNGHTITLTNDNIKYIAGCGYTKNGEPFTVELV